MQHTIRPEIENNTHPHVTYNGRTYYQINEDPHYYISIDGHVYSKKRKRELTPSETNGYQQVGINGRGLLIHRLIYETFVEDIPEGMTVNHINTIRNDNRLENLELVSQRENNNKKANHENLNELPPEAIKLDNVEYQMPTQIHNLRNLYYFDNRIYERFDTCYRAINPISGNRCYINGILVALRKLTRIVENLVEQQRQT